MDAAYGIDILKHPYEKNAKKISYGLHRYHMALYVLIILYVQQLSNEHSKCVGRIEGNKHIAHCQTITLCVFTYLFIKVHIGPSTKLLLLLSIMFIFLLISIEIIKIGVECIRFVFVCFPTASMPIIMASFYLWLSYIYAPFD